MRTGVAVSLLAHVGAGSLLLSEVAPRRAAGPDPPIVSVALVERAALDAALSVAPSAPTAAPTEPTRVESVDDLPAGAAPGDAPAALAPARPASPPPPDASPTVAAASAPETVAKPPAPRPDRMQAAAASPRRADAAARAFESIAAEAPAPPPAAPVGQTRPNPGPAAAGDLAARHAAAVRARIERAKRYPAAAHAARQTGVVRLRIVLGRDGSLIEASVAESAGWPLLDAAAVAAARAAAPFPPAPESLAGERFGYVVPMRFER